MMESLILRHINQPSELKFKLLNRLCHGKNGEDRRRQRLPTGSSSAQKSFLMSCSLKFLDFTIRSLSGMARKQEHVPMISAPSFHLSNSESESHTSMLYNL